MNTDEHRLNQLTEQIIGCAYKVANTLGHGFLEKVYENAMAVELHKAGLSFERQKSLKVMYDGVVVGEYVADLVVSDILVENKAVRNLDDVHLAQCINYLKATGLKICLLINFGASRVQIRRLAGPKNLCSSVFICG
jgi:GxxExxY protein